MVVLRRGIEIMHIVGVLNGRGTIISLKGGMPLHPTGLIGSVEPN